VLIAVAALTSLPLLDAVLRG